jgi:DNA-binding XRE family transcriptional regulator
MSESKRIPGFKLTPEQRGIVEEVRRRAELEKPEILEESRRRTVADEFTSVQLRGAIGLLRAVRKAQGITLDELAGRTGIAKPTLSRLENTEGNLTINTLQRIAEALGHAVQVSVVPKQLPASTPKAAYAAKRPAKVKARS